MLVHDGHGGQVVLEDVGGDVLFGFVRRCGDQVVVHALRHGRFIIGEHQGAQRADANQLVVFIQHVYEVDGRMVLRKLAKHLNGVPDGVSIGDGYELRGHHAAGGAVLVAEQAADLRCVFHAHKAQKRFGALVGQVAHDVGCVVRVHVTQHVSGLLVVQAFDEVGLVFVLHLRDGLGCLGVVEVLEHVCALLRVQLLQNARDVGGVQLVQAFMGDGQLYLGQVAIQQIHIVPRDDLLVDLLAKNLGDGDHRALDPGSKAA